MITLIKNGLVYDGTGKPPEKADVLVRGGTISRIGALTTKRADRVVDASNAIVTPGFIDVNTSSDHLLSLFSDPAQEGFVAGGTTTIIGGNCGVSLAPLMGHPLAEAGLFGHPVTENVGWSSVREFLALLNRRGLGVNFGTLVGHGSVRRLVAHSESRDLSDDERDLLLRTLDAACREGAFGISAGSDYLAMRVPPREAAAVAALAASRGRVYAVHLRDFESELVHAVREIIGFATASHANVEVSHLVPQVGHASQYAEALDLMERASAAALIHFDLHSFDTVERPLSTFLPAWARRDTARGVRGVLAEEGTRERVLAHVSSRDLRDARIGHVFDAAFRSVEGRPLAAFAEERDLEPAAALVELARLTGGSATVIERTVDSDMQATFLKSQHALIASNAACLPAAAGKSPKAKASEGTGPRRTDAGLAFLAWAQEKAALPFGEAVAKLTSKPARKFGIPLRGRVAEGYAADLLVLRDLVPVSVLINGAFALADGVPTGVLAGRALAAA